MQLLKPYRISRVASPPNFDSLPVAKIVCYPLEKRDYRPFAQSILCVSEENLYLRMWAFEVSPMPTSALHGVLYPFGEQSPMGVRISLTHGGGHQVDAEAVLLEDGKPAAGSRPLQLEAHPHNGEDLQGVYWGATLMIPLSELTAGELCLSAGDALPGNFYKTCEDARFAHYGSLFPAQFPHDPYGRESMGEFLVVSY